MKEFKKKEESELVSKLEWEAPELFCLDKRKTEGGEVLDTYEDTFIDVRSS